MKTDKVSKTALLAHTSRRFMCELCYSYTMGCLHVRGDNPRALASGLFYVQVDKHGITIFYTTFICVDLEHDMILRAKVGKGGIKV